MDPRLARRVALVSLVLGIVGDVLFDRVGLGINVPITVGIALLAALAFRPSGARIDPLDLWIPPVALVAALGVALRSDPPLVTLDLGIAGVATLAWMVVTSGQPLTRRSLDVVAVFGVWASAWLGIGAIAVATRLGADRSLGRTGTSIRRALPVVRGLVLALPVVLVLASLLASSDDVFARLVGDLFHVPVDLGDLALRLVVVAALAWLVAGALSIVVGELPFRPDVARPPEPEARSLGAAARARPGWILLPGSTEATVVVAAVDILFAGFVAVQLGYLFGGLGTVLGTGITFSDYARSGYFQLVAVVVLAGALLIVAEAAAHGRRSFLVAALSLLALTFVILASAAVRLALYQQIYGWTELRFYVAASIAWLAIGGVLLGILIVRDRIRWLVHGLALAAVAVTLAVTAIGPQAFITSQNLARALDPSLVPPEGYSGLDAEYISVLGDDAIPELVAAWPRLDARSREALRPELEMRKLTFAADSSAGAWQAWNLARERAREALSGFPPD